MQAIPTHGVGAGVGAFEGVVMEIVITFALVYTVYATAAMGGRRLFVLGGHNQTFKKCCAWLIGSLKPLF